ncbi:MAG: hypothetical protein AAFU61_11800, partial [Pseudomonadota bacterium]
MADGFVDEDAYARHRRDDAYSPQGRDGVYARAPHARRSTASLAAGAAVSAALLIGGAIWAQGLATRDPGEIPFLRAEDGPMKVQPDDPGGLKLAETDLAVERMVAGREAGEARPAAPAEGLADEDLPAPMLERAGADAAAEAAAAEEAAVDALVKTPAPAPTAAKTQRTPASPAA